MTSASPRTTGLDPETLRGDFPILGTYIGDARLVYLDSAATSQKPQAVIDAEVSFLTSANAAVHRGAHTLAAEATELFEDARATVAGFVGAEPEQLVWTSGATAGINLVAYSIGNATGWPRRRGRAAVRTRARRRDRRDRVRAPRQPHPLAGARRAYGRGPAAHPRARRRHSRPRGRGIPHRRPHANPRLPPRLERARHRESGGELVALARSAGALTVLDACQSAPHLPLDLPALGVDLAVFSGHKMLGPYAVGGLRPCRGARSPAAVPHGRIDITTVTLDEADYLPPPQRFEAGTQPVSQAIGLAAAVRYLEGVGMDAVHAHEQRLERRLRDGLRDVPGLRLLGDAATGVKRVALSAFDLDGVHAHDVGQFLDARGIAVRVGHHCAQPLHRRFGLTASVRASAALYTTDAEIDTFLDAVSGVRAYFGAGR